MPITPAMQNTEVGGSKSKASPGKNARPYLKNKTKLKKAGGMA
jgi:hypothetical protein